ncbi:hypothetical protein E2C01_004036 [Portunus trituberculatus]|uniref:Uncharacterized protein n=1 Tax=Portunus trituberculatus TaxID=210409 RepID=A0A5B7CRS9_PORTR|nr:hypothetical protein [Portunus trituberculatus]
MLLTREAHFRTRVTISVALENTRGERAVVFELGSMEVTRLMATVFTILISHINF